MIARSLKSALFAQALLLVLFGLWLQGTAEACTGLMLRNADGSIVHGRTLEFGIPIETTIVVVPGDANFAGNAPGGPGMKYKAKSGAVGTIAFKDVVIADGLNEKGLAVGAFYFPTYARYAEVTDENRSRALSPLDFPNWILTRFETVANVRQAIEHGEVVVAPTVLDGWRGEVLPLHYVVYDKSGECIAIEPVDGKLKIYDNHLRVLTNSPTLDWHMTNLRNYIAMKPLDVPPVRMRAPSCRPSG